MCRLYGLQATHPTEVDCALLDAHNALIAQSKQDARGLSNPHGWGMGHIANGTTSCFRQVHPAFESQGYRKKAAHIEGTTILAHVRRATVGDPKQANTHPFRHGPALLAHNGHVPAFEAIRPHLLDRLSDKYQGIIHGDTDSEHIFALLLQLLKETPGAPLHVVTRDAVTLVQSWVEAAHSTVETGPISADVEALPHAEHGPVLGLNLLWTDGDTLAGVRLNRTLWSLRRQSVPSCSVCGSPLADPPDGDDYASTVFASERLTDDDWTEVPNGAVFSVSTDGTLTLESLDAA